MCLCVGGAGWHGGFMYALYREKGASQIVYMSVKGEKGVVKNPELSSVSTSSKIPHANVNLFVFNVF